MLKTSMALLFGAAMSAVALTTTGCTEQVSSSGEKPTSSASEAPAGGSGSSAPQEAAPKTGSGSR